MPELKPVENHLSRGIVEHDHVALPDHHHLVDVRPICDYRPTVFLVARNVYAVERNYTVQVKVERTPHLEFTMYIVG
jgi:hypothetical protein